MTRKTRISKKQKFDEADASGESIGSGETSAARGSPADALSYIRDMVGELRDMAEEADQLLLAYLLDMEHEEARLQTLKRTRQRQRAAHRV